MTRDEKRACRRELINYYLQNLKLAQALKDSRPLESSIDFSSVILTWNQVVLNLCTTLQFDNPQFNRARFLHACGYTQEG